jgi:hypothetical protein
VRFRVGPVPESATFDPVKDGWTALREPSPWLAQLLALPIALVLYAVVVAAWLGMFFNSTSWPTPFWQFVVTFVLVLPLHEFVHVLFHPMAGAAPSTIVGVWPAKLLLYAHYDEAISRDRFVVILLSPLFLLTVVPMFLCALSRVAPGPVLFLTIVNAMAACIDVLGAFMLLVQVPRGATVRNLGYRTWWTSAAAAQPRHRADAAR